MFVSDPLHYLALIETKPNALDQAAPLQGWDLPEAFQHLRHLLEARMGNRGKREFIQVLRLMEAMPQEVVDLRRDRGDPARRHQLRCGQADRVGADRATAGPSRPVRLSPSAQDRRSRRPRPPTMRFCCRRRRHDRRSSDTMPTGTTSGTPQVLLAHHLKQLKLPTVLREYDKVARECARDGVDHPRYLLRLIELELIDRERRMVERRIRAARFPAVKSFDTLRLHRHPQPQQDARPGAGAL